MRTESACAAPRASLIASETIADDLDQFRKETLKDMCIDLDLPRSGSKYELVVWVSSCIQRGIACNNRRAYEAAFPKLTVTTLQDMCEDMKCTVGGNKAELVRRVIRALCE